MLKILHIINACITHIILFSITNNYMISFFKKKYTHNKYTLIKYSANLSHTRLMPFHSNQPEFDKSG